MTKITSLTVEQRAEFPRFVRKWIEIGLCTKPADRERAERAIHGLYALAKLREPRVIWLPCPISAALSAVVYATLIAKRLVDLPASEAKAVYSAVDSAVGLAVYSAVDSAVDSAVYSAVDSAVYSAVGSAVGLAVYSAVDSAVYSAVRSAVDSADVKQSARNAGTAFFGGSLWLGYPAWADYFNEVCGIAIDRNYLDAAESCGFYWTLDNVCFASERPVEILRDDTGRLHNDRGMAIRYPSGWGLYRVHGVEVPRDIVEDRSSITVARMEGEANSEVRRVMIELYGQERYLIDSGAQVISHDKSGILYRKELRDDEPIVMVRVLNSTPEPDGVMSRDEALAAFGVAGDAARLATADSRWKSYFIRVDPSVRTAQEAVAWTFNMKPGDYAPALET